MSVPARVSSREPVPFTLVVENVSDHAIDILLRGRTPTFDVIVSDSSGAVIWQRLEHEIIPAIVHVRRLAAHDSFALTKACAPNLDAGTYEVWGELLLEDSKLSSDSVQIAVPNER